MGQFDVYALDGSKDLFLELQSSGVEQLPTRIGAPLVLRNPFSKPVEKLHPILLVRDEQYIMLTHHIFSVPIAGLRQKVGNVSAAEYQIKAALDMLFYGF